jgi:hypothetical protein
MYMRKHKAPQVTLVATTTLSAAEVERVTAHRSKLRKVIKDYFCWLEEFGDECLSDRQVGMIVDSEMAIIACLEEVGRADIQAIVEKYVNAQLKFRDQVGDAMWRQGAILAKRFYVQDHEEGQDTRGFLTPRQELMACIRDLEEDVRHYQLFVPKGVRNALYRIKETRREFKGMCQNLLKQIDLHSCLESEGAGTDEGAPSGPESPS